MRINIGIFCGSQIEIHFMIQFFKILDSKKIKSMKGHISHIMCVKSRHLTARASKNHQHKLNPYICMYKILKFISHTHGIFLLIFTLVLSYLIILQLDYTLTILDYIIKTIFMLPS